MSGDTEVAVPMSNDREVAFPTLSARDLAALTTRGQSREVKAGETLFREGDRNRAFFVVLEGAVEITEHSHGTPPQRRGAPAGAVHR